MAHVVLWLIVTDAAAVLISASMMFFYIRRAKSAGIRVGEVLASPEVLHSHHARAARRWSRVFIVALSLLLVPAFLIRCSTLLT